MTTTISVTPGYIGQKTSADKSNILTYSITTDGTMSDITEKINGVTIATRTNPTSGQNFTVSLSQAQWDAIKYGNAHTLTITMGSDVWTYTFDKRLHANDDILSAVKGVQDLYDHLNAIKSQLGVAIRSKGGSVNDTDPFSAFVSAVANMTVKKWASGTVNISQSLLTFEYASSGTANRYYIEVTGLTFNPETIIAIPVSSGTFMTVLTPQADRYNVRLRTIQVPSGDYYTSQDVRNYKLDGVNAHNNNGFRIPTGDTSVSSSYFWIAFE